MTNRTLEQQTQILHHAIAHMKSLLTDDATGHDWPHIDRVRKMTVRIAQAEGIDTFLPELIAILHEAADRKVVGVGKEEQAVAELKQWLTHHGLTEAEVAEILYAILNQSYSASGLSGHTLTSVAGQIVQDADRLEAIGAIGIARCFAYNGKRGNPIHDPEQSPRTSGLTAEIYKQDGETSINHFYEKLLKLRALMNTETARQLADHRHQYMEKFLEEFYAEWDGQR